MIRATLNLSHSEILNYSPPSWRYLKIVVSCVFIAVTILGNSITLYAVLRLRPLQNSVSNLYIGSLAAADLLIGAFVASISMVYKVVLEDHWVFGTYFCDIWLVSDFMLRTISLYSMGSIGFDRWWNLEKPLRVFKRSRRVALRFIIAVWAVPVAIWIPLIFVFRLKSPRNPHSCTVRWNPSFSVLSIASPVLYVPVVILVMLFFRISCVIRSHLGFLYTHSATRSLSNFGAMDRRRLSPCPPSPLLSSQGAKSSQRKYSPDSHRRYSPDQASGMFFRRESPDRGCALFAGSNGSSSNGSRYRSSGLDDPDDKRRCSLPLTVHATIEFNEENDVFHRPYVPTPNQSPLAKSLMKKRLSVLKEVSTTTSPPQSKTLEVYFNTNQLNTTVGVPSETSRTNRLLKPDPDPEPQLKPFHNEATLKSNEPDPEIQLKPFRNQETLKPKQPDPELELKPIHNETTLKPKETTPFLKKLSQPIQKYTANKLNFPARSCSQDPTDPTDPKDTLNTAETESFNMKRLRKQSLDSSRICTNKMRAMRSSVTSDTAVVFTNSADAKKQRLKKLPKVQLERAKTELQLHGRQRRASRFSVLSLTNSFRAANRNASITIFNDFATNPGMGQQIKASKAVVMLLVCFLFCWMPFLVVWPLYTFGYVTRTTYDLAVWANYLNSALNPILYTLCSPRVRQLLKERCLKSCKLKKNHEQSKVERGVAIM